MSTTGRVRTLYTPPTKGQKTAALYVVALAKLPDCAKRVFPVLVWHVNSRDGRCDPSQELLQHGAKLKSPNSVSKALRALEASKFIITIRQPRPHHSAAYQINWPLLTELQKRWEESYQEVMTERRCAREAKVTTRKAILTTFRPTDILPGSTRPSPHVRGGIPPTNVGGTPRPNTPTSVGGNSIEPYEDNSVQRDEPSPLRRGSSRLADPMPLEDPDQGLQRETYLSDASQKNAALLRATEEASRRLSAEEADAASTIDHDLRLKAPPELYELVVEWVPDAVVESASAAEREKPHSGAPHILEAYKGYLTGTKTTLRGDVAVETQNTKVTVSDQEPK